MNLKRIIPVCITIIIVAAAIGIILNEYIQKSNEGPCPPLCDYDQDELKHESEKTVGPDVSHDNENEQEPYPGYDIKKKALEN